MIEFEVEVGDAFLKSYDGNVAFMTWRGEMLQNLSMDDLFDLAEAFQKALREAT